MGFRVANFENTYLGGCGWVCVDDKFKVVNRVAYRQSVAIGIRCVGMEIVDPLSFCVYYRSRDTALQDVSSSLVQCHGPTEVFNVAPLLVQVQKRLIIAV